MGIGIGLIIVSLIMILFPNVFMSDYKIEKRARELGMKYPDELRVLEEHSGGDKE